MGRKYDFDYIVIGSGAAGGTAAQMAAGAGLKVALIEADRWGGSEANYRDVPYMAGLHFSQLYAEAVRGARFGMSSVNLHYNYPSVQHWLSIAAKRAGANSPEKFEKVGVRCLEGVAHFVGPHEIAVGEKRITGKRFLIATGSVPLYGGITGVDTVPCLTPDMVMYTQRIPKVVIVVGAGATGCEIAQYYADLGSKVLIAEAARRILPKEDLEVSATLTEHFVNDLGVKVLSGAKVVAVEQEGEIKTVVFTRGKEEKRVRVEEVVLATGTAPMLDLGLENAGVKYTKEGIKVDKSLHTSAKHIMAAGDVLGGVRSSTEQASYEGAIATANIVNRNKSTVDYTGFVRMVETYPKVASVGLTEAECKKRKLKYRSAIVKAEVASAANTRDFKVGFVKILVNRERKVIGATVVSPEADTVIQELVLALRAGVSMIDLAGVPHVASSWSDLVRMAARRLAR